MTTTMTLRLDEETQQRLLGLSKATDRSRAHLALQALKQYLDQQEWQVQAIRAAVEQADAAGVAQFVDHETVLGWMESWGTEHEKPKPQ